MGLCSGCETPPTYYAHTLRTRRPVDKNTNKKKNKNKYDNKYIIREVVTVIGDIDSNPGNNKKNNIEKKPQVQSNIFLVSLTRKILKSVRKILV